MTYVEVDDVAAEADIRDDKANTLLGRALNAAQKDVDDYCGWGTNGFDQSSGVAAALEVVPDDRHVLELVGGFWTTTDLVIKTDENSDGVYEVTWTSSDYELEPANNQRYGVDGFPYHQIRAVGDFAWSVPTGPTSRRKTVEITAIWGWENVPAGVETALILRALQLFSRRKTQDGINPISGFRAGGRDRDWEILLDDYRHPRKKIGLA